MQAEREAQKIVQKGLSGLAFLVGSSTNELQQENVLGSLFEDQPYQSNS